MSPGGYQFAPVLDHVFTYYSLLQCYARVCMFFV